VAPLFGLGLLRNLHWLLKKDDVSGEVGWASVGLFELDHALLVPIDKNLAVEQIAEGAASFFALCISLDVDGPILQEMGFFANSAKRFYCFGLH
jgi:hypothetical protein